MEWMLSEQFKQEYARDLGIRPSNALEAVRNPDRVEEIRETGLEIRLFLKRIDRSKRELSLLVLGRVENSTGTILGAYPVFPDLCHGMQVLSPVQLLEQVMERFGEPVRVGARHDKFILRASIPIQSPNDIEIVSADPSHGHSFSTSMFLSIEKGPPMIARCALCYCLNTDAYKKWIDSH